jgi:hypothetical protein
MPALGKSSGKTLRRNWARSLARKWNDKGVAMAADAMIIEEFIANNRMKKVMIR